MLAVSACFHCTTVTILSLAQFLFCVTLACWRPTPASPAQTHASSAAALTHMAMLSHFWVQFPQSESNEPGRLI